MNTTVTLIQSQRSTTYRPLYLGNTTKFCMNSLLKSETLLQTSHEKHTLAQDTCMYNAAINELYLVQITGLWGTWSLFNTYCSSSYIKYVVTLKWYSLLKTLLQTVAQCSYQRYANVHNNQHIPQQGDQITTKKEKVDTFVIPSMLTKKWMLKHTPPPWHIISLQFKISALFDRQCY